MAKLVLNDITSGYASITALNDNFALIENALENTLSRDGTSPNQMSANLDMNGYAVLNARATTGNENFLWLDTWVTGRVYAVNNLVYAPEGSNEGNTLICVTAHTAGASLDGDAAKWAVFAQRGAPGASGGDVVGPASATPDSLARYNGTTGKLLKDGAVIGTHVQAYNDRLTTLAGITAQQATDLASVSTFIGTLLNDVDAATARATLGAGTGNGTVTGVTGTAPVVSSGGTTPAISMPAASAGADGYMSAAYASKLDGIAAGANVGYPTDAGVNAIGMLVTAKNNVGTGAAVASGGTASGATLVDDVAPGTLPGTWRNVGASSVADTAVGRFQRIA